MNITKLRDNPVIRFFYTLLERWTQPIAQFDTIEERRAAQFTASALLAIGAMTFLSELLTFVLDFRGSLQVVAMHGVIFFVVMLIFIAYLISRTRYYKFASLFTIILLSSALFVLLFLDPIEYFDLGDFLIIGSILAGIFYRPRAILIVLAVNTLGLCLVMLTTTVRGQEYMFFRIVFLVICTLALYVMRVYQEQVASEKEARVQAGIDREQALSERERRALIQARDAALSAARTRSEFLSNMSHEIRTPMGGLLGMLELLYETDMTDEQRQFVDYSRQSGRKLLHVLDDILDYSRLENNRMVLETVPYMPSALVQELIEEHTQHASKKNLVLSSVIAADVPPEVYGDPNRVRQILDQLIGNAIKFTDQGAITISIHVIERSDDRAMLRFEVADTGSGISLEHLDHVFDGFMQVDTSITRRYGGTGIGLSITKRLVELMGGAIDVTSEKGSGSTFRVSLPVMLVSHNLDRPSNPQPPAPITRADGAPPIILAVDDNDLNLRVIISALSTVGCIVHAANGGFQALEQIQHILPDLILMDVNMPEMDGLETTRRIRSQGGELTRIPIIALSAGILEKDINVYLDAGMEGVIRKPFAIHELRTGVRDWIGKIHTNAINPKEALAEQ